MHFPARTPATPAAPALAAILAALNDDAGAEKSLTEVYRRALSHQAAFKDLLALEFTEAKQNGALYFNLARMVDIRNDKAEALRRYEQSLAAFKTMKEPPEGAVPVVTQRIKELSKK